ncbi:MAG TPA: kelch repeat-containing protein [Polyangiaceae bacterium]|nr:kelch repeat-containing protein [Polyangiaceae bacterium]
MLCATVNRSSVLALLSSIALGLCFVWLGCAGDADAPAADAIRDAFPKEAALVLGSPSRGGRPRIGLLDAFVNQGGGALDRKPVESCSAALPGRPRFCAVFPARGSDEVIFSVSDGGDGFNVRVREEGAFGDLEPAEEAIAYRRAGGFSYWAKTPGGFEEWLLLEATHAEPDRPAASWIIEGAEVRQVDEVIGIFGPDGKARVRVAAPASFAASGRPLSAKLVAASPSRVDLYVDGGGERVLVDPSWTPTEAMLMPRQYAVITKLASGQVLVAGGLDSDGYIPPAEIYDPLTNIWIPGGSLKLATEKATMTLLAGGKALYTGGIWRTGEGSPFTFVAMAQLFNPATKVWTEAAPMLSKRALHTAVRLQNGKVLVIGGGSGMGTLSSTEIYDPVTNTWTPAAPTNIIRVGSRATLLPSGKVLLTGGEMPQLVGAKTVEIYDPAANTWTVVAPLKQGRLYHRALVLPDGRVLVAGSSVFIDVDTTEAGPDDAEIYDPATNTWTSTSLMPRRAWGVTLSQLENGKVLVTHREVKPKQETFAQLYDPEKDLWTITKSPAYSYYYAEASPLDNGKVLLVGGLLTELPPVAELYDPGDPLGSKCGVGDDCESGICVEGICCDRACGGGQCEACSIAKGAPANGICADLQGSACDDGDPCSLQDTCGAEGICSGTPRVCNAIDECHEAGACDPATGLCLSPPRPDGSACGDGVCDEGRCTILLETTAAGGSLLPNPAVPASCTCRILQTPGPSKAASGAFGFLVIAALLRARRRRGLQRGVSV